MISLRVALAITLSPLSLNTQAMGQPESTQQETQDFTKAVDLLIKSGFPDTRGAQYVKVNLGYNESQYSPFGHFEKTPKLTGNAWFIPDAEDAKKGKLILGKGVLVDFTIGKNARYNAIAPGQTFVSTLKEADIEKDIAAIHKWLTEEGRRQTEDYGDDYADRNLVPPLFTSAVMAHRAGHTKLSNPLILDLLANAESPEIVIDSVVDTLGDQELEKVTRTLFENADWQAYYQSLVELDKKYLRGWQAHAGLSLLLPQAKARASQQIPKLKLPAGVTLTNEVQALVDATVASEKIPALGYPNNPLWLVNGKPAFQSSKSPFSQLTAQGIDGFLALTLLLEDETLILQEQSENDYYHYRSSFYSSSYDDPVEQAYKSYSSMKRPKTRGEIAKTLITPYFQANNNGFGSEEITDDQLKAQALDWWKKHRNATKLEITKYFLENGSSQLLTHTINELIQLDNEEAFTTLEKAVLESAEPSQFSQQIKPYLIKRKDKAKDFLVAYKKALTNELGDGLSDSYENSGQYAIKQAGGVEKFIKKLDRYTQPLKPSQLITKLARKTTNTRETLEVLAPALKGKELGKLRPKIIYAAAKSKPRKALAIIQLLNYSELPQPKTKEAAYAVELGSFEIDDWRKLLAVSDVYDNRQGHPLNQHAHLLLEQLFNPNYNGGELMQLYRNLPETVLKSYVAERTELILTQKDLPPLPSASQLNQEQLDAVISTLTEAPATELHEKVIALSPAETLASMEYFENNDEPANFAEARKLVQNIYFPEKEDTPKLKEIKQLLKASDFTKTELNKNYVEKLLKILKANQDVAAHFSVTIYDQQDTFGYTLGIFPSGPTSYSAFSEAEESLKAGKTDFYIGIETYDEDQERQLTIWDGSPEKSATPHVESILKSLDELDYCYINILATNKASYDVRSKKLAETLSDKPTLIAEILKLAGADSEEELGYNLESMSLETLQRYHDAYSRSGR